MNLFNFGCSCCGGWNNGCSRNSYWGGGYRWNNCYGNGCYYSSFNNWGCGSVGGGCGGYPEPCCLFTQCNCNCNNQFGIIPPVVVTTSIALLNPATQTIVSGGLFALGTVSAQTGSGLTYNGTNTITANSAGTYRINYSFDWTTAAGGVFAFEIAGFPATRRLIDATTSQTGTTSGSIDLTLALGQSIALELSAVSGGVTLNQITASNLVINVNKVA